ncbi:hypothetical protein ACJIZ3_011243 [Penstemon smallii]|uniref:Chalcone-flavonone isomerase family protein n=1 Tax=Penstemon smallii TaxID=265156 RepID=A0ABD3UKR9_9LAMI
MASIIAISTLFCNNSSLQTKIKTSYINQRISFNATNDKIGTVSHLSTFAPHIFLKRNSNAAPFHTPLPKAASSSSALSSEYTEEPGTKVKFQTMVNLPGCPSSLSLLGAGYREKVFAIIGVKVYAAALYANQSIFSKLDSWKGRSASEVQKDSSLYDAIFQASLEKSLHIVLVRDVDGKTFWDALDEAISPRIKSPTPVDESALSTFRSIFQGRSLKKGTSIFLTWLNSSKILVCVSSDVMPSVVDATIESSNVTYALFDVFFGQNPVSSTLKASVSNGLAAALLKTGGH